MKIKKIKLENNPILGDIELEFTDESGRIINNVIIAGENGTGKTTLLEIIYDFCALEIDHNKEIRQFTIELTDAEVAFLQSVPLYESSLQNGIKNNEVRITIDYYNFNNNEFWFYKDEEDDASEQSLRGSYYYRNDELGQVLKGIYSTTEVNYTPESINAVTAGDIDLEAKGSIKSTSNIATEITQLLVDIKTLDDSELSDWVVEHPNAVPIDEVKQVRMKRFMNAFNYIFPAKRYSGVRNENGNKKVYFKEYDKEMPIEKLSSGEKQIVFRGSFLLKDQKSSQGIIALIDEPELSLHPDWQMKIVNYFKRLFINEDGEQTSQLFFVTHSPFIIHNNDRIDDKIVILKKDENGDVYLPAEGKFFSWTSEQVVKEAFNINSTIDEVREKRKNLIITEGKTDWKHLKRALLKLQENELFVDVDFEFLDYEGTQMGHGELLALCKQVSKIQNEYKIVCIFDRDVSNVNREVASQGADYKSWGNNVYSLLLPVPKHREETPGICIEHYYFDSEITLMDETGKRMYLGNEFSRKSGQHILEKDKFCQAKNKVGGSSISIIDRDCDVFVGEKEDENIALSKNQFAENILQGVKPFDTVNFDNFQPIFEIIEEIIQES
ncbi:AAA family ATPase [Bacillus cereus group sp. Bc061]|uniref:AAA family ATPase n=1 Tax=Bacillus cereus group TaxID=86661 RepID=UPI0002B8E466|nr:MULTISPECIES: ATP-binding protein [Bacillus cereus group]MDA2596704.1 AAA family ATPase [Bacillus cereus group sp. Bc061]RGO15640.1 hypothetical protein DXB28_24025 [Bacillus cereus]